MMKNVLIAVIAATGTLFLLGLTLFVAVMGPRIPGAVLLAYALSIILIIWRARRRPGIGSAAPAAFAATRRWTSRAFLISAVGAIVAVSGSVLSAIRPSQAELAGKFREHRGEYEKLRDMLKADGLLSVSQCGRQMGREPFQDRAPELVGIERERQADYERRLRSLGCPPVFAKNDGSVSFALAYWGAANHGWRISLVWSKAPPQPQIATIDEFVKQGGRSHSDEAFSRVEGDWYLAIVW